MSFVGSQQWQYGIVPSLIGEQIVEYVVNFKSPPRWTGLFAKVRLPLGSTKADLGHTIWVNIYTSNHLFYQIGFAEASTVNRDMLAIYPNMVNVTSWRAFYASNHASIGNIDNVISFYKFDDDKELFGEPGKTYGLWIELTDDKGTLELLSQKVGRKVERALVMDVLLNEVVLVRVALPDSSKFLEGGYAGPQCSITLESVTQYTEEEFGDLGPFHVSEILLQADPTQGIDVRGVHVDVGVQYHLPPPFLGVKRTGADEIIIGKGLPRITRGTI